MRKVSTLFSVTLLSMTNPPRSAGSVSHPTPDPRAHDQKRLIDAVESLTTPPKRTRIYTPSRGSSAVDPSNTPIPDLPSSSAYQPYSPLTLLSRLRTFHPSTYSPSLPAQLGPEHVALYGWTNRGRQSLTCGACSAVWDLSGADGILDEGIRSEVGKRLVRAMTMMHKKGCPWRVRASPRELTSGRSRSQLKRLCMRKYERCCILCYPLVLRSWEDGYRPSALWRGILSGALHW